MGGRSGVEDKREEGRKEEEKEEGDMEGKRDGGKEEGEDGGVFSPPSTIILMGVSIPPPPTPPSALPLQNVVNRLPESPSTLL